MSTTKTKRLHPDDTIISYGNVGTALTVMTKECKGKRKGFLMHDSSHNLTYGDDLWCVPVGTIGTLRKAISDYDAAFSW